MGLVLAAAFLALASCDEVERHKTLTFFFDGVPPLPGEGSEATMAGSNTGDVAGASRTGGWYIHEAIKDCTQCHPSRRQRTFSRQAQLVAEVPQLCYKCHQEYTALEGWVHGPVATGECLLCHEPHKTKSEFLLLKPVPELCYQCHEPDAVRLIEHHAEPSYARCIDCHAGHASAARSLLRPAFLTRPDGRKYLSEVYRQQYEESLKTARNDLARGEDLSSILQTVIGHVNAGRLWAARAYLEVVGESEIVTGQEKLTLSEVRRQLAVTAEGGAAEHPDGADADASLPAAQETLAATLRAIQERRGENDRALAECYYRSVRLYHAGELTEAREGLLQVLSDASVPGPIKETAKVYLERIEKALGEVKQPGWQQLR